MMHPTRSFLVYDWQGAFPKQGEQHYTIHTHSSYSTTKQIVQHESHRQLHAAILDGERSSSRQITLKTTALDIALDSNASMHTKIASILSKLYHDIDISVHHNGNILCIENHAILIELWSEIKQHIMKEYHGREVYQLLEGIELKLNSETHLIEELEQYHFFGLLFNNLYQYYQTTRSITHQKTVDAFKFPLKVSEHRTIAHVDDLKNEVLITSSFSSHEDTKTHSIQGNGTYLIDSNTHWIKKATIILKQLQDEGHHEHSYTLFQN